MRPNGTLLDEGQHATLTFRRLYPHTVERVWEALTTPERLREWDWMQLMRELHPQYPEWSGHAPHSTE